MRLFRIKGFYGDKGRMRRRWEKEGVIREVKGRMNKQEIGKRVKGGREGRN